MRGQPPVGLRLVGAGAHWAPVAARAQQRRVAVDVDVVSTAQRPRLLDACVHIFEAARAPAVHGGWEAPVAELLRYGQARLACWAVVKIFASTDAADAT